MQNRLVLYCTCHHMSCIDIFGFSHEITRQLDDLRSVIVDTIAIINRRRRHRYGHFSERLDEDTNFQVMSLKFKNIWLNF